MSKRIKNFIIIEDEPEDYCEYCGKLAELRPYGKAGKRICLECGLKNVDETTKNMEKKLFGIDENEKRKH